MEDIRRLALAPKKFAVTCDSGFLRTQTFRRIGMITMRRKTLTAALMDNK